MSFIIDTLLLFLGLGILVMIPGWSVFRFFGLGELALFSWEKKILTFGLGLVTLDFLLFLYSKVNLSITPLSLLIGVGSLFILGFLVGRLRKKEQLAAPTWKFSTKHLLILLILILATGFIKTFYLAGSLAPTATDLGHHMYWAKWLAENHQLPVYEGMPDFIIGEHTLFGSLNILTGLDFFGPFPIALLFIINFLSILAMAVLALRFWKNNHIALLTILFLGVLFAVTSPQAKFISGGVIGNLLGNFFVPLIFFCYWRAFEFLESKTETSLAQARKIFSAGIFINFGLFYTHHLTSFIFLFVSALTFLIYFASQGKSLRIKLKRFFQIIFSKEVLLTFFVGLIFFFWVFTPTYVQTQAVGTAVGAPSKNTRAGLDLLDMLKSIGEARLALGFIGLVILFFSWQKEKFGYALTASWMLMIYIMSSFPALLFINLPSDRIGNYLSYPAALLSAYATFFIFRRLTDSLYKKTIWILFLLICVWAVSEGVTESINAIRNPIATEKLAQTFSAAQFVDNHLGDNDQVLKDHNYLTGDTWIKLFFMRGYTYPLSRSLFKRYEDETKPREMCTLQMISTPDTPEAKECFKKTAVNFLMVNPQFDGAQFRRNKNFNGIYSAPEIAVFYRTN